jgi:hypothetical protein
MARIFVFIFAPFRVGLTSVGLGWPNIGRRSRKQLPQCLEMVRTVDDMTCSRRDKCSAPVHAIGSRGAHVWAATIDANADPTTRHIRRNHALTPHRAAQ